jgi:hypothetical protein
MAVLQGRSEAEMPKGFDAGLRAYVAWRHGWPATWERVATQTADTGELDISFAMPTGERDLWNVATLEAHRGLGVYPPAGRDRPCRGARSRTLLGRVCTGEPRLRVRNPPCRLC